MSSAVVSCSAPGKVLITGGYLILDPENQGLVVSVSSRFHSQIRSLGEPPCMENSRVRLLSPQFDQGWEVQLRLDSSSKTYTVLSEGERSTKNPYVAFSLQYGLAVFREIASLSGKCADFDARLSTGLEITIRADNEFYSQQETIISKNLPFRSSSLEMLPPFNRSERCLDELRKTGLGSSATLTSSLLAALGMFFEVLMIPMSPHSIPSYRDLELLHNLSQFVHCLAQGKIGSGFDVSSAIFGSQIYSRFSPAIMQNLLGRASSCETRDSNLSLTDASLSPVCAEELLGVVSAGDLWDNIIIKSNLPPGFSIVLGDINCGSNTPSMVGKVLQWRKEQPEESRSIWQCLKLGNLEINQTLLFLQQLHSQSPSLYFSTLSWCSMRQSSEWKAVMSTTGAHDGISRRIVKLLVSLAGSFQEIRRLLKQMGDSANVPIEPDEQTRLLDATAEQKGVVFSGVPGAGGFDAIFAIVLSDPSNGQSPVTKVEELWISWPGMSCLPQLLCEEKCGILATVDYSNK